MKNDEGTNFKNSEGTTIKSGENSKSNVPNENVRARDAERIARKEGVQKGVWTTAIISF